MFINNFILETKGKKGKKERRIYTWDLQFTDLASYAHDYAVLMYCVVTSYRRFFSFKRIDSMSRLWLASTRLEWRPLITV